MSTQSSPPLCDPPFVTYSLTDAEDALRSPRRDAILAESISPLEKEIFDVPIAKWRGVDRSSFAGWRCSVAQPRSIAHLLPLSVSDPILRRLALYKGPVTDLALDAIVNAANKRCLGGGGVDGAIHAAAGPLLRRECAGFNGCATGQCRVTKGYALPARYVLHTAGPVGERPEALRSCYASIVSLVRRNGLRSVGFCGISTGIYGYPVKPAARIALGETMRFIAENTDAVDLFCFACFQQSEYDVYLECIPEVREEINSYLQTLE